MISPDRPESVIRRSRPGRKSAADVLRLLIVPVRRRPSAPGINLSERGAVTATTILLSSTRFVWPRRARVSAANIQNEKRQLLTFRIAQILIARYCLPDRKRSVSECKIPPFSSENNKSFHLWYFFFYHSLSLFF